MTVVRKDFRDAGFAFETGKIIGNKPLAKSGAYRLFLNL